MRIFDMEFHSLTPISEEELQLPELVYWASLGNFQEVEQLLSQGVDPNQKDEDGYSALQAAAENGYLDIVHLLVLKGVDVHYKAQFTALELAKMAGNSEIVAYLENF